MKNTWSWAKNLKQGGAALWVAVVLIIVIGVIGMVILAKNKGPDNNDGSTTAALSITEKDHIKGNAESNIVLVEYSDFQCPACGSYYPLLKQLNKEFGDKILFAYRHFPLSQHKNAKPAAMAAEAAGKQNKFWQMHDTIFENQDDWSGEKKVEEIFISYAEKLELDIEQFKNDLNSEELKEKVNTDYKSGVKARVLSTPSFFLNNKKITSPESYKEFKDLIQQAIGGNENQ